MAEGSERQQADEWISTRATITACRQSLLERENFSSEGYIPGEYIVTFSYVVNGRTFEGKYRASTPQECGHTFEILYDPARPNKNTGSDALQNPWIRITAGILGIISVLIGIWLWEDKDWF
jgi:hypothetical protein